MKKELQKKLIEDFPTLFKYYGQPPTPMMFGIGVGDGWFNLLYDLCKKVVELDGEVHLVQVKEKFGGLRFYIDGTKNEEVWKVISEAEERSFHICEKCGKPGTLREGGWLLTLCDKCDEERNK